METWLRQHFAILPNAQVKIYETAAGYYGYDPTNATTDFAGISVPPTHAALSAHAFAQKGNWQRIFDDWKSKGLIQ